MLVVTGTIEVEAGDADGILQHAREMAMETRKEPGCIKYAFYRDIENPACFRVYEEWEDEAALKAHFESPHMAVFRKALGAIRVQSREIVKFEPGPAQTL